jgi:hypothetical protein
VARTVKRAIVTPAKSRGSIRSASTDVPKIWTQLHVRRYQTVCVASIWPSMDSSCGRDLATAFRVATSSAHREGTVR